MTNLNKQLQILSIEGNIGSGKSTVINTLKQLYNNDKIYFLEEPVSEWNQIVDVKGKNIIEKFYEDQNKYSFPFQIMAYISRLSMLKKAINYCKEHDIYMIVCERSLQTDKNVFCKMLYDMNKIEDVNFQIYNKWFDEFINEIPTCYFIYIKTCPTIANERVLKRNRKGETINLEYLELCSKYHDNWLLNNTKRSIIIDGNQTCDITYNKINDILKNLLSI